MMFRGAVNLSMDAKGRLAMPAKFRDVLVKRSEGNIVLTAHLHACLLLYPQPDWEPVQERIMRLSSFEKRAAALQRRLVGHAEDLAIDSAGRFLVSAVLREIAGLDKEVMLVGLGDHFELWDKTAWDQQLKDAVVDGVFEMPTELEGFSL